jgi:two-component system, OmpR family, alkaline phosphatase synthesis response regulator PhoP
MKTVLVVEDEPQIARLVRDYLEVAGFAVLVAGDGEAALHHVRAVKPDLMVLDLGLPGLDGLDVMRKVRTFSSLPIIVLTARADESDRIVGLELGADDYVVKPFSPKELVARVRAVLRRATSDVLADEVIRVADLVIDVPAMRVSAAGARVELTTSEFQLLLAFARRPGRVLTRGQLLQALRGVAFESYERAIDAHVKNLRRKLEAHDDAPTYIETVYGVGYRFSEG